MSKQPATPSEMADQLAARFPPPLTVALLEEYGLEQVAPKAPELTRELLALCLYWVTTALEAHYPGIGDILVLPEVRCRLRERWTRVYNLAESEWQCFHVELAARFDDYNRVTREGGTAIAVSSVAAAYLESNWVVRSEEQPNLLSLIVDHIAVDAIGDVFEDYDLVGRS